LADTTRPSNIMFSQLKPRCATLLYSRKCSWNLAISGITAPLDRSIPLFSSRSRTIGLIFQPLRQDSKFESLSILAIAIINACAKQFWVALIRMIIFYRCAMTKIGLLNVLIAPPPNSTGILTECTFTTRVSKALNLELHRDTFSNTLHITSPGN